MTGLVYVLLWVVTPLVLLGLWLVGGSLDRALRDRRGLVLGGWGSPRDRNESRSADHE